MTKRLPPQDDISCQTTKIIRLTHQAPRAECAGVVAFASYLCKIEKWAGTCRTLVVKLTDGTEHTADFQFKK